MIMLVGISLFYASAVWVSGLCFERVLLINVTLPPLINTKASTLPISAPISQD